MQVNKFKLEGGATKIKIYKGTIDVPPFLTIITRHLYTRKALLKRNKRSVRAQTDSDWQQIVIKDKRARGYQWADKFLRHITSYIEGKYVYILDDDDHLIYPRFLHRLKKKIKKHGKPDIVICQAQWRPFKGRILPGKNSSWGKAPKRGDIGSPCFVVKREAWCKWINHFGQQAHGDYHFIHALFTAGDRYTHYWWDKVVAEVGQIGHIVDKHC